MNQINNWINKEHYWSDLLLPQPSRDPSWHRSIVQSTPQTTLTAGEMNWDDSWTVWGTQCDSSLHKPNRPKHNTPLSIKTIGELKTAPRILWPSGEHNRLDTTATYVISIIRIIKRIITLQDQSCCHFLLLHKISPKSVHNLLRYTAVSTSCILVVNNHG